MREIVDRALADVEYTYRWYRDFLGLLLSEGYAFGSFADPPTEGEVLLRHDVDLSVEDALRMARAEADLGVEAAYFFLLTSRLYNPLERETRERIREIADLGHDVGLHFSTHQYWPDGEPPVGDLEARVAEERALLGSIVPDALSTVSFHVPPGWVLDRDFEAFPSTYEPALFTEVGYLADSGGRWREESPLADGLAETMQVLVHPGLWHEDDVRFNHSVRQAATASCRRTYDQVRREFLDEGEEGQ